MKAEAIAAAWQAELDFDPTRGVPLSAFVRQRVLAHALTRSRREWAYGRQCRPQPEVSDCNEVAADGYFAAEVSDSVRRCLDRLPKAQRWLIECLYWEEMTEVEVGRVLSLSQQAISLRKRRVLEQLRSRLDRSERTDLLTK